LYPDYPYNSQPIEFICKGGVGRQMSMPAQCGATNINWVAVGCTITGQNTLTPTITPTTVPTGSTINVYAVVSYTGGCVATTPTKSFQALDATVVPIPVGYVYASAPNGDICTTPTFDLTFVSTNGFNNGISTVSPDFTWGPGDAIHYKPTRTKNVTVCNKNLCTGQIVCKVYTVTLPAPCAAARMANNTTIKIVVTPNPTNGKIEVQLPESLSGSYQIFDQNTSLIQEAKFENQNTLQIELSSKFDSGIYILKVLTETNSFTEKIILNNK
jgi:hypothetical protein